jgi:hypothetical protein
VRTAIATTSISQGYEIGDMAKPVLIARRITDLSDEDQAQFCDGGQPFYRYASCTG